MEEFFSANEKVFKRVEAALEEFEKEVLSLAPGGMSKLRNLPEQREIASICDAVVQIKSVLRSQKRKASGPLPSSHLPLHDRNFVPPSHSEVMALFPKLNHGVHPKSESEVTQKEFARWMGVDPKQIRRWATGDSNIPNSVWRLWLIMNGLVTEIPLARSSDDAKHS